MHFRDNGHLLESNAIAGFKAMKYFCHLTVDTIIADNVYKTWVGGSPLGVVYDTS